MKAELFDLYQEIEKERQELWCAYWAHKITYMDLLIKLKNLAVYRSMQEEALG